MIRLRQTGLRWMWNLWVLLLAPIIIWDFWHKPRTLTLSVAAVCAVIGLIVNGIELFNALRSRNTR